MNCWLAKFLFLFEIELQYNVFQENPDSPKNIFLLKNPQFLPNHCETLSKWGTYGDLILTKFF